jgi:transcriptional regulator with XRE-family HTH domain
MLALYTVDQLRRARTQLKWTQLDLARRARVDLKTVKRLEAAKGSLDSVAKMETLQALQDTLEGAGISFMDGGEGAATSSTLEP